MALSLNARVQIAASNIVLEYLVKYLSKSIRILFKFTANTYLFLNTFEKLMGRSISKNFSEYCVLNQILFSNTFLQIVLQF